MADFPPNLEDGELWIPSDILPDIVSTKTTPEFPSELTYMEDLAQQLAAYALLERKQEQRSTKPPPNLNLAPYEEQFGVGLQSRFGPVVPPGTGYFGVGGGNHSLYASGNGGFRGGSRPVYQYFPMKPVQTQVENFAQTSARVSQRQQNHSQTRFLPYCVNEQVMGGFIIESGGTGVFLPRIANSIDTRKNKSVHYGQNMRKVVVKKQEGIRPPAEKGLPQDWTY